MDVAVDAKGAAVQRICELLRHNEDLLKLPMLHRNTATERVCLEVQLKTAMEVVGCIKSRYHLTNTGYILLI